MASFRSHLKFSIVFGWVLTLAACSATQIAYRNADTLLTRYAVKTLDLNGTQQERLEDQLADWLLWHRTNQVPRFHARLSATQRAVADRLDLEESAWLIATVRGTYKEVLAGLNPIAVDTLLTLSSEQIAELEKSFQEENAEFREEVLEEDPDERQKSRYRWFRKHLERWLDDLTQEQEQWLQAQLSRYPSTANEWLAYRESQQNHLLSLLRNGAAHAEVLGFLNGWSIDRRGLPESFARSRQKIYDELPARVVELDALLTPEQRRHVMKRIQFFEEIVAGLILLPGNASASAARH